MIPLAIPWRLVGALVLAAALFAAGWTVNGWRWQAAVERQKVEAAAMLQAETERALLIERANAALKDELEKTHAENQAALDRAYADARRAVAAAGGLRDPGRRPGGSCPVSAAAQPAAVDPGRTAEGRLSAEAEEFLWAFARDADAAAEYAGLCHRWAVTKGESTQ